MKCISLSDNSKTSAKSKSVTMYLFQFTKIFLLVLVVMHCIFQESNSVFQKLNSPYAVLYCFVYDVNIQYCIDIIQMSLYTIYQAIIWKVCCNETTFIGLISVMIFINSNSKGFESIARI